MSMQEGDNRTNSHKTKSLKCDIWAANLAPPVFGRLPLQPPVQLLLLLAAMSFAFIIRVKYMFDKLWTTSLVIYVCIRNTIIIANIKAKVYYWVQI